MNQAPDTSMYVSDPTDDDDFDDGDGNGDDDNGDGDSSIFGELFLETACHLSWSD